MHFRGDIGTGDEKDWEHGIEMIELLIGCWVGIVTKGKESSQINLELEGVGLVI